MARHDQRRSESAYSLPFQVGKESLKQFETRLARARTVLSLRGIVTNPEEAMQALQVARLADRYHREEGL